ncbi:gene transfer agent family protein [Methylobacterium sp. 17Sr1-1]|uniref:gene transfer agent family protein n=1 Tax=Methylobacterium sp. 17Sr1-1 TaxID=2202826 RepID=UPI000D6FE4E6|nr:gene transfer agent family protein [Methylobacterium sp. 17Sr1-1]AWN54709.1 gene transfer agent family protein [Methylobacterium sp. 17Sr1-1]
MSRDGHIDLALEDATHRFRLAIGDLEALQEATGMGPAALLQRFHAGRQYRFRDVRDVLRLGLIGGGTPVPEAHALARRLDGLACIPLIAKAALVLAAALEGAEDERVGRPAGPAGPEGRIAFAAFYAAAAAMGLPAADLRAMSLWQLAAYIDGFNRARDPEAADAPTPEEEDALWAWLRGAPDDGSSDDGAPA